MKNAIKFRIEKRSAGWVIVDPDNVNNNVPFDQAIVDATHVQEDAVEGFIVAIHGLSNGVADLCDGELLRALGVGAQLSSQKPVANIRASGMSRVRLMPDGTIEGI